MFLSIGSLFNALISQTANNPWSIKEQQSWTFIISSSCFTGGLNPSPFTQVQTRGLLPFHAVLKPCHFKTVPQPTLLAHLQLKKKFL